MKTILSVLVTTFCLLQAAHAQKDTRMHMMNIATLDWHPKASLPSGAFSATAIGDPAKGDYAFYGKFPSTYTVPNHWHSYDCSVVIIQGRMTIKQDGQQDVTIEAGGFFTLPAKMKYTAYTPDECIFFVYGQQPFDIIYTNSADDPRSK